MFYVACGCFNVAQHMFLFLCWSLSWGSSVAMNFLKMCNSLLRWEGDLRKQEEQNRQKKSGSDLMKSKGKKTPKILNYSTIKEES